MRVRAYAYFIFKSPFSIIVNTINYSYFYLENGKEGMEEKIIIVHLGH